MAKPVEPASSSGGSAAHATAVDYRFIACRGAKHAFTNPQATERGRAANMPLAYDASADAQSWAELQTFLEALFTES